MSETTLSPNAGAGSFPHVYDGYSWSAESGKAPAVEQFVGMIRKGPASTGQGNDYTDARYYIDRAIPNPSDPNQLLTTSVDPLPGVAEVVTATNLAEVTASSHLLTPGTLVQVSVVYARSAPQLKAFVINQPPPGSVVVKITGSSGAGTYDARILSGNASAVAGEAEAMPMGLNVPSTDNALVLNLEESGQTGNRLQGSSFAVGVVQGTTRETKPRSIVVIGGGVGKSTPADDLGSPSDASESAETTTWTKSSDARAVSVFLVTRVVYNPAGSKTLLAFARQLLFDARGILLSVGAETTVTVDATEACP